MDERPGATGEVGNGTFGGLGEEGPASISTGSSEGVSECPFASMMLREWYVWI